MPIVLDQWMIRPPPCDCKQQQSTPHNLGWYAAEKRIEFRAQVAAMPFIYNNILPHDGWLM